MMMDLKFLAIIGFGVCIAIILWFLFVDYLIGEERTGKGTPEKIQVFVDEIVQQIQDTQVTDKLREFWKNAERTVKEWRREMKGETNNDPPKAQSSESSPIKVNSTSHTSQPSKNLERNCLVCGTPSTEGNYCSFCGTAFHTCPICRKHIWQGEQVIECPMCGTVAHTPHILEWLRVKGTCPNCREKLVLS